MINICGPSIPPIKEVDDADVLTTKSDPASGPTCTRNTLLNDTNLFDKYPLGACIIEPVYPFLMFKARTYKLVAEVVDALTLTSYIIKYIP